MTKKDDKALTVCETCGDLRARCTGDEAEYEPETKPVTLGQYAAEMLESLKSLLAKHDKAVSHLHYDGRYCETPDRGRQKYVHDRGSRRPTKGVYNVFCMVGPEGMGYYPCWCNPHRALLAKIEKEIKP